MVPHCSQTFMPDQKRILLSCDLIYNFIWIGFISVSNWIFIFKDVYILLY